MKPKSNNQLIDSTNESPSHNITQISRENIMIKKTKPNAEDDLKTMNISIVVVALAKYNDNKAGLFVIIDYKDVDGKNRRLMIPASIVNDLAKLKKLLIDNCFAYSLSNKVWVTVQEILNKKNDKRMQLVENPGFHNGVFLQADNKVIGKIADGQCSPILDPTSKVRFPMVERKGKLAEWKSNIAVSALYSSRIMLTITAAFSSSLLKITDIESGGFHLYGKSSTGKSTCQYAAQSVQGSQGSIESWSVTETGAEELAAGHNDQLLVLDELGNLDSDPVKAAQKATKMIYTIAFGKDKRRSVNYTGERLSWRIIFISSGENSLTEHAAEGGTKRMLGEEVRLIDVPADAGNGLGIYEQLPNDFSPAQYADNLKLSCKSFYGTPQQAFLKKFIHEIAEDIKAVKEQIAFAMKEFMDKHNIDSSKGYEVRMAKRFALAYAGGKLAVEYGILPFDEKQVMSGISKAYVDTINSRPKTDTELVQIAYNTIANELRQSSNFLDISSREHGFSIEQIEKASGYKSIVKGKEVRVIKSDVMEVLIPNNKIRKMALDEYVAEGRLVCDAAGNQRIQVKSNLKPPKALPRAYCFLPKQKKTEA